MQHAQLMSHVDTDLVSRAQLRALPQPETTRTFKPIPHIELIEMLELVLNQNQIRIDEERFALRRDGSVSHPRAELVLRSAAEAHSSSILQ